MNVVIVGGGKIGTHLARLLLADHHTVRVIEIRREELVSLERDLPAEVVVIGSGTDPNVLEAAGIREAQVMAAVTGDDETNLVAAGLARFEFRVSRIIGRVNNPRNAWLYQPEMGIDVALNQADMMARLVAEEMSLGDMMTLLKLRKGQFSLVEEKVHPESIAVGCEIKDLNLPKACVLTAIIRKGDLIVPHGDVVLQTADEIIALVHADALEALAGLLGRSSPA